MPGLGRFAGESWVPIKGCEVTRVSKVSRGARNSGTVTIAYEVDEMEMRKRSLGKRTLYTW